MKPIIKKLLHMALILCVAVSLSATVALADSTGYSITMNCTYNGSPVSGVTFHAYRVLEQKADGSYALTTDFSTSGANVTATPVDWAAVANTLAVFARAHTNSSDSPTISPISATTDGNGKCTFSLSEAGSYLILGDSLTVSGGTYSFSPSLITLPDANGGKTVTAAPKMSYTPWSPPGDDPISVTALKIWNDGEQEDLRPDSITVSLLRNDSTYDTVQLSASNNWRYTWSGLNPSYTWSIIEVSVPDEYTVEYTQNGNIWSITNTYTPNIPPENPPTTDIPPENPPTTNLPQTGLLQWPIPLMAVLGIVLFSLGWRERFGRPDHEK